MDLRSIVFAALILALGLTSPASAYTNLTPQQAYDLLLADPAAMLLDVRTNDEWLNVGHPGPDADNPAYGAFLASRVFHIPWEEPRGVANPNFDLAVTQLFALDDPLLAFCRTGSRSVSSCLRLEQLGFTNTYNVLYGFEGKWVDDEFQNGWRDEDLPYNKNAAGLWPAALDTAPVPLPAGLPLLASGLGLLALWGARRRP